MNDNDGALLLRNFSKQRKLIEFHNDRTNLLRRFGDWLEPKILPIGFGITVVVIALHLIIALK